MKIIVKARPNSKNESVEKIDDLHFEVSVKEPPVKGMANEAIRRALAAYFKISPSRVNIVAGHTSKSKIVEIK
ncbi:hypothetical protein A2833_02870 [Candidatus Azambacteria bacterium RIFCSPHIGHO2_01_FULL_44_55]|uniref:Uncharacterized protein n=1 Tax=Candidatus Azambacteria bacterium RIFCSPLOWO2_02_FULL_44_14 TaxID=1797306 RepID=A0A1F5CBV3_9BACT|nr:MAG: hypothetical protein A3A18_02760 [Candidatus Azambacteria bacterium RIFCSPLOWO2_01_FULL_44_84]OGD33230.1 MAG: hypothetical protein A3C78_03165 [Candidatus Azambacteria bacterium RIFCSPHIGHO2_02_FULL_45_18]OGD40335.1 MAG: hypothetical protein A3I30_03525 [Candidatus Azambacteria bacterium RIFCSPLOWO2_02_FULL_44_14]OGD40698.1 MAG: hypothetical protein A2833_02870 [Candidatus Azambacteria bacterium RIFCSPHIGHO2_01_FULL_44_55]OGD52063.1 MAG: hypothetical protein A2608_01865 [Candidatus Azam